MKQSDSRINGVTVRKDGKAGCWCEIGMRSVSTSVLYKTCFLVDKRMEHNLPVKKPPTTKPKPNRK